MKKHLFIISALLFSITLFSQGIEFEHGTWKEVLAKAQQTSKPIFIDVFTSWCGPCKKMSKEIFPLAEVGKVYNTNFICYQVDAEKGDGIEIAKEYKVMAYPTYLFIKPDGKLFYTTTGSMEAVNFINISTSALTELKDTKPISIWDKEYPEKKNDPLFILEYMNKRSILGMSNATLFDEYLKLIPEKDLTSDIVVKFYMKDGAHMKVNSYAFENLLKNKEKYIGKLFGYVFVDLLAGVMNTVKEAATTKDDQLLATAIKAYDQIPNNSALKQKDEIYMEYYQKTNETDGYLKHATNFCDNYLMKISLDSLDKKDYISAQMLEKQIKSGAFAKLDSSRLADLKQYIEHAERNKISESLNNIAWEVFKKVSDKNALQDALLWSKRSLELTPNDPLWLDTYANLLYKLGQKEDAISKEQEAMHYTNEKQNKGFGETLRKMKAGEKTWKD